MERKMVHSPETNLSGNDISSPLFHSEMKNGMEIVFQGGVYRVGRELIGKDGWSVVLLTDMSKVDAFRMGGFLCTAVAFGLIVMVAMILHSRTILSKKMARLAYQLSSLIK
jgi:hypothetical protein